MTKCIIILQDSCKFCKVSCRDLKYINNKEFERVLNILNGKSVLQSAIKLREKIDFDREGGTKIYLKLLSVLLPKFLLEGI